MLTIATGLIVGLLVLWGGIMLLALFAHGFNAVVDWFMR